MIESLGFRNVGAARFQRDHHFHLVMEVLRLRRVGHIAAVRDDGIGWLLEEDRWVPLFVAAHFAHMRHVVAAYAIDASDGKGARAASDADARRWRRFDHEVSLNGAIHGSPPTCQEALIMQFLQCSQKNLRFVEISANGGQS
jgi:hypothetical protein